MFRNNLAKLGNPVLRAANEVEFVLTGNQGDAPYPIEFRETRTLAPRVVFSIPRSTDLSIWMKTTLSALIPGATDISFSIPTIKDEPFYTTLTISQFVVTHDGEKYPVPGPMELRFGKSTDRWNLIRVKTSNLVFCDLLAGKKDALENLLIPDSYDAPEKSFSTEPVGDDQEKSNDQKEASFPAEEGKIAASSFIEFLRDEATEGSLHVNIKQRPQDISRYFNFLPDSTHFNHLTSSFIDAFNSGEEDFKQWFKFVISQARYDLLTPEDEPRPEILKQINFSSALIGVNKEELKSQLIAAYIQHICSLVADSHLKNCSRPLTVNELAVIREHQKTKNPDDFEEYYKALLDQAGLAIKPEAALCGAYFTAFADTLTQSIGNGQKNYADINPNIQEIHSAELKFHIAAQNLQNTLASLPDEDPRRAKGQAVLNTVKDLKQPDRLKKLTRVLNDTTYLIKNPDPVNAHAYRKKAEKLSSRGGWRTALGVVMTGLAIATCFTPAVFIFGYSAYQLFKKPTDKKAMEPLTAKAKEVADETVNLLRSRT